MLETGVVAKHNVVNVIFKVPAPSPVALQCKHGMRFGTCWNSP